MEINTCINKGKKEGESGVNGAVDMLALISTPAHISARRPRLLQCVIRLTSPEIKNGHSYSHKEGDLKCFAARINAVMRVVHLQDSTDRTNNS